MSSWELGHFHKILLLTLLLICFCLDFFYRA